MMVMFVGAALAQDDGEVCWDCLNDSKLYRIAGAPGDPHPEWWVKFDEALSVTVVYGVIAGGGGLTVTPSGKPKPVDPEDWRVVVQTYADERDLAVQIGEVEAALDASRLGHRQVGDIAETVDLAGVVAIVAPRDEGAALDWIVDNGEALARADHPTLLFLEAGGEALESIPELR